MASSSPRNVDSRELSHDRMGETFATALSDYDTRRRLETLIDDFLGDMDLRGKRVLDVGCGLGMFSGRLAERGAVVTACDLGPNLVEATRRRVGCEAVVADALVLEEQFGAGAFDGVLSSECVEHTPDPERAVRQMCRVLKPGGWLSLSTPNRVWSPVVRGASRLKLRPFAGLENFSSWRGLRRTLLEEGVEVVRERGLHLFPFQLRMHGLSRWLDDHAQRLRGGMINICILGRKIQPQMNADEEEEGGNAEVTEEPRREDGKRV